MFDFIRLRSPIIQAPMAGGINTPELVSASINAGVVGSFGFAYSSPVQISKEIKAARSLIHSDAHGALNCNFFVLPENLEVSAQVFNKLTTGRSTYLVIKQATIGATTIVNIGDQLGNAAQISHPGNKLISFSLPQLSIPLMASEIYPIIVQ